MPKKRRDKDPLWLDKAIEEGLGRGFFKEISTEEGNKMKLTEKGRSMAKAALANKSEARIFLETLVYNELYDYAKDLPKDEWQLWKVVEKTVLLQHQLEKDGLSFLELYVYLKAGMKA